jgi:hypothetical protein
MDRYAIEKCQRCETTNHEAQHHFTAEHSKELTEGTLTQSDVLYAGRMAESQHAIRPGSNYVNPRDFSASRRRQGAVDNRLPGDRGNPVE